ncbi:MAG: hypothetical protein D6723_03075 [Acidobacteria bacterium]|nr:MAG: hypothetical protein D6723_03075 [Acidobacteriota bacterium]
MKLSKSVIHPVISVLILSLMSGAARRSLQKETPPENQQSVSGAEESSGQREQVLQTLRGLIPMIEEVEDIRDRVRLKARAAGLLWSSDRPQARFQFRRLLSAIDEYPFEGKKSEDAAAMREQLRREVILEVTRYDRQFAEELAHRASRESEESKSQPEKHRTTGVATGPDQQRTIERERYQRAIRLAALAHQSMSDDPERALKLAEESMAEGIVTFQIFPLLIPLKRALGTDRVNPLFERTLTLLLEHPRLTTQELQLLAIYIFPDLQLGNMPGPGEVAPVVSLPLIRQFLELALRTFTRTQQQLAIASKERRQRLVMHAYFLTQQLRPKFEQYGSPEAITALMSISDQLATLLTEEQRQVIEANAQPQANVAKMLELAERATDPGRRDAYRAQAAMSAYASGDYVNALNIAKRIEDREMRTRVEQQIKKLLTQVFAERGEFDAALKYAREVSDPVERASMLNMVARIWVQKEKGAFVMPILVEAEQIVAELPDSVEKAMVMLWITETHIAGESERAFSVLAKAVESINRAFDEKGRPKYRRPLESGRAGRSNEILPRMTDMFRLEPIFRQLGRRDFDRTVAIALELNRRALRLQAELAACEGALMGARPVKDKDAESPTSRVDESGRA